MASAEMTEELEARDEQDAGVASVGSTQRHIANKCEVCPLPRWLRDECSFRLLLLLLRLAWIRILVPRRLDAGPAGDLRKLLLLLMMIIIMIMPRLACDGSSARFSPRRVCGHGPVNISGPPARTRGRIIALQGCVVTIPKATDKLFGVWGLEAEEARDILLVRDKVRPGCVGGRVLVCGFSSHWPSGTGDGGLASSPRFRDCAGLGGAVAVAVDTAAVLWLRPLEDLLQLELVLPAACDVPHFEDEVLRPVILRMRVFAGVPYGDEMLGPRAINVAHIYVVPAMKLTRTAGLRTGNVLHLETAVAHLRLTTGGRGGV